MKKFLFFTFMILSEAALIFFGIYTLHISYILSTILFALALLLFLYVTISYNTLVRLRHKTDESFSLIDIHLKMRFDLIPNLVSVVKSYAKHEEECLKEVVKLRKKALACTDPEEKIEYANKSLSEINNVIAVAESYPELKADKLYKKLMDQLVEIEERLSASRRIYDSNVNYYNSSIQSFPNNIVASVFKFKKKKLFKINVNESINININLSDGE